MAERAGEDAPEGVLVLRVTGDAGLQAELPGATEGAAAGARENGASRASAAGGSGAVGPPERSPR
eukprot:5016872-Alexandrium_andersonii.AAC.1